VGGGKSGHARCGIGPAGCYSRVAACRSPPIPSPSPQGGREEPGRSAFCDSNDYYYYYYYYYSAASRRGSTQSGRTQWQV
jgi:hypothetical protein